jgi:uncharacterized protein YkwD
VFAVETKSSARTISSGLVAWIVLTGGACCLERSAGCFAQETGESVLSPDPEMAALIAAHNRERKIADLPPLVANAKLEAAARIHARDMAEHDTMSHDGSDGSKFQDRTERQGYHGRKVGENVAEGQRTVEKVIKAWMNSPHHRDNILGDFSEIGAARSVSKDGVPYWCVDFGLPRPVLDPGVASAGVVDAVNQAREKADLPPMKANPQLTRAAQDVAKELAAIGDLGKAKPTYAERVRQAGYRYRLLGEAAASGQPTPDEAVQSWLDSPRHQENFLGKFTSIGVGYATSDKEVPFWVVFLAQPLGSR